MNNNNHSGRNERNDVERSREPSRVCGSVDPIEHPPAAGPQGSPPPEGTTEPMSWPAICRHCGHLHDSGKTPIVQRYTDCSVWRCPNCKVLIDDRPPSWGGSLTGQDAINAASARILAREPR